MTKRRRMSAKDSAPLYAALMVEEWGRRRSASKWGVIHNDYYHFLRSQRDTHPAYALAIKAIEGASYRPV